MALGQGTLRHDLFFCSLSEKWPIQADSAGGYVAGRLAVYGQVTAGRHSGSPTSHSRRTLAYSEVYNSFAWPSTCPYEFENRRSIIMKFVRMTGTTAIFLMFGTVIAANAQLEGQEPKQEQHPQEQQQKPQPQQKQQQQPQ